MSAPPRVYRSTADVRFTCRPLLLCVSTKIEKEKREHAKQHGMIRTEITGAEIAEEMEKERRLFQLQMCEVGGALTLGVPETLGGYFSFTGAFMDLSVLRTSTVA